MRMRRTRERLLAEPEQAALHRLGSLGTPRFTPETVGGCLGRAAKPVRRLLESLIEANMVTTPAAEGTVHATVYELPRLLRCYLGGPRPEPRRQSVLNP
jgi:hypothetical protein